MYVREFVPQGPVPYRTSVRPLRNEGRAGKQKARSAPVRVDSCAFLNDTIKEIPVAQVDILSIRLNEAYNTLVDGLKKFYWLTDMRFYEPKKGTVAEKLCALIERTEKDLEKFDVGLSVQKTDYNDDELTMTLYKHINSLDNKLFTFYLSPIDYLPKPMNIIYARYIRYIADCLNVHIMPENSDNYFLSMTLDALSDEYELNREAHDEDDLMPVTQYEKGGEFYNTFLMAREADGVGITLKTDIRRNRAICEDADLCHMMDMMLEGMEILPFMSMENYMFNPFNDGFTPNDGFFDCSGCVAFVYSGRDGLEEMILDSINNDVDCGIQDAGWNKWINLESNFGKEDVDFLLMDEKIQDRFRDWADRFYNVMDKWDKWH